MVEKSADDSPLLASEQLCHYQCVPQLGPRVLFFSGGTALKPACKVLRRYTHNSIHLVTPFDSGGSSAKLRESFHMLAIGDLRSRLMALADESISGHCEVFQLFNQRLTTDQTHNILLGQLKELVDASIKHIATINNCMSDAIAEQFEYFLQSMPETFDLRGASIGNLILAGGYLKNDKQLHPIVELFSGLINVQGTVRTIVEEPLHLGAVLHDGSQVIGQHLLTGKEVEPLSSPIKQLFLSKRSDCYSPTQVDLPRENRELIKTADLICYPPGSFYTSLIANLLPKGVAKAIAANDCPKVFIPNLGNDPELLNTTLFDQLEIILQTLESELSDEEKVLGQGSCNSVLDYILIDSAKGCDVAALPMQRLKELGVNVVDTDLVGLTGELLHDPELMVRALLELI